MSSSVLVSWDHWAMLWKRISDKFSWETQHNLVSENHFLYLLVTHLVLSLNLSKRNSLRVSKKSSPTNANILCRNMCVHIIPNCTQLQNIKHLDKVSNDRSYGLTGTSPLLMTVILQQLKFLGHILRMEKDETPNIYMLYEPSHEKSPSERPWRSFSCQVREWIKSTNSFLEDDIE